MTDKNEMEAMNSHFINAAPIRHSSTINTTNQQIITRQELTSLNTVKEEEVSAIIMALDSKKSSGPSDINAKCLQVSLPSILPSITRIINNSLMTGIVRPR